MSAPDKMSDARAQLRQVLGPDGERARERLIASLPRVEWRGRPLLTIRCHGTTGKGPHDYNVPEIVIWSLVDPEHRFLCPFHR